MPFSYTAFDKAIRLALVGVFCLGEASDLASKYHMSSLLVGGFVIGSMALQWEHWSRINFVC